MGLKPSSRQRILTGPLARLATSPIRAATVGRYDASVFRASVKWLVQSREFTNFTYDITELNRRHLAWFVADIAYIPVTTACEYLDEVSRDSELSSHVREYTHIDPRGRVADPQLKLGRRMGWYALVRATQPDIVVETGTDKGLGSCVIAAALLRNGHGTLTTIDVNPSAGFLIKGRYADVVELRIANALNELRSFDGPIDFFIHDSDHSKEHEAQEIALAAEHLAPRGLLLSDNAHVTSVLADWAEARGSDFSFFHEVPKDHWYPGAGIGVARAPSS